MITVVVGVRGGLMAKNAVTGLGLMKEECGVVELSRYVLATVRIAEIE